MIKRLHVSMKTITATMASPVHAINLDIHGVQPLRQIIIPPTVLVQPVHDKNKRPGLDGGGGGGVRPPGLREERLAAGGGDELVVPAGLPGAAHGGLAAGQGLPARADRGGHPQHDGGLGLLPGGGGGVRDGGRVDLARPPSEGREQEQEQRLEHGEDPAQREQRQQRADPPRRVRRLHAPGHPPRHPPPRLARADARGGRARGCVAGQALPQTKSSRAPR